MDPIQMTQQIINVGTGANTGTGDTILTAMNKANANFTDLYNTTNMMVLSFNTRIGNIVLTSADVTGALGYTPANKAGDTFSGVVTFTSSFVSSTNGSVGAIISANAEPYQFLPAATSPALRLIQLDGTSTALTFDSFISTGNPNSNVLLRGSRGTGATPLGIQNTDIIGSVSASGYGTTMYQPTPTATIGFVSEGTFSDSSQPTAISFQVTPSSSITPSEVFRINSAGALVVSNSGTPVWTINKAAGATGAFQINRYNSGTLVDTPISISNSTGIVNFADGITVAGNPITTTPHGSLLNVQVFTSSGTYTPTTGTNSVIVEVQAPGGGSGGTATTTSGQSAVSGPGGGGAYAKVLFTSGFSGATITIGAAGSAGTAGNGGGTGGFTKFGSLITCNGGWGGSGAAASSTAGVTFVTGVTPLPTITGATVTILSKAGSSAGASGVIVTPGSLSWSGPGGNSVLGEGGTGIYNNNVGQTGVGYGSGAGGTNSQSAIAGQVGAAGQPGIIIVYEFS